MMPEYFAQSQHKILLVEDNDLNCDVMQRRLSRRGYTVITATSGREAIELAHSEIPALILMDLQLPDISGCDAARTLKADSQTQRIPLIALTAHAMERDRERALAAGCDEYETKPIDLPRLLEKIHMLLNRAATDANTPEQLDPGVHPPHH